MYIHYDTMHTYHTLVVQTITFRIRRPQRINVTLSLMSHRSKTCHMSTGLQLEGSVWIDEQSLMRVSL